MSALGVPLYLCSSHSKMLGVPLYAVPTGRFHRSTQENMIIVLILLIYCCCCYLLLFSCVFVFDILYSQLYALGRKLEAVQEETCLRSLEEANEERLAGVVRVVLLHHCLLCTSRLRYIYYL